VKGRDALAQFGLLKADTVDHWITDNVRGMNQPLPQTVRESLQLL
jgi:hypothetical protein